MAPPSAHVLLITGSMGSGKTTVLGEASDILAANDIPHAAIDLDFLNFAYLAGGAPHDFMPANLAAIRANYAAALISRFLIAGAIETRADWQRIEHAIPGSRIVTCRLTAPVTLMEQRVAQRERGIAAGGYIARVAVLERLLDAAHLEDFSVPTDAVSITEVARTLLSRAAWI